MNNFDKIAFLVKTDEQGNKVKVFLDNYEVLYNEIRIVIISKLDNDYVILVYNNKEKSRQQLWLTPEALKMMLALFFSEEYLQKAYNSDLIDLNITANYFNKT